MISLIAHCSNVVVSIRLLGYLLGRRGEQMKRRNTPGEERAILLERESLYLLTTLVFQFCRIVSNTCVPIIGNNWNQYCVSR
jgi:hypothetical protein